MNRIRSAHLALVIRTASLLGLIFLLLRCPKEGLKLRAQSKQTELAATQDAHTLGSLLLMNYPEALDKASQSEITDALKNYNEAAHIVWLMGSTRTALTSEQVRRELEKAVGLFQTAAERMARGLEHIPELIRLSGRRPVRIGRTVPLVFESAVLVVNRQLTTDPSPAFIWRKVDLSSGNTVGVDLGDAADFVC